MCYVDGMPSTERHSYFLSVLDTEMLSYMPMYQHIACNDFSLSYILENIQKNPIDNHYNFSQNFLRTSEKVRIVCSSGKVVEIFYISKKYVDPLTT